MSIKEKNARLKSFLPKKRPWLIAAVVVVVIAAIVLFFLTQGKNNRVEPAAILQRGYLEYTAEADGLIESALKSEVYAPSSLRVGEIFVREGDAVRAGDVLALLDTEALELEIKRADLSIQSAEANMTNEQTALANSVTSARNSLSSANVSLETARREYNTLLGQEGNESMVTAATINLEDARRAYENSLSLFDIGGISAEALTQSQNMLDKAQTAYDDAMRGAQESLKRARETLEAAQIRQKSAGDALNDAVTKNTDPAAIALELQRVAYSEKKLRLRDASITAPASGIVTLINAKVGAPASGLMFIIENDQELIVRARVGEADIPALSPGMRCRIRPVGQEKNLSGYITLLPRVAEREANGAFSAVTGDDVYFIVEATIEDASPDIFIGMNAKVSFIVEYKDACFAVPGGLVYRDEGHSCVITRGTGGRLTDIPVGLGLQTRHLTEIISESLYEGMELYNRAD